MQLAAQATRIGRNETGEEFSPARDRKSGIERNGPGQEEKSQDLGLCFFTATSIYRASRCR